MSDNTDDPIEDDEEPVVDLDEAEPSEAELVDATVPPDPAAAATRIAAEIAPFMTAAGAAPAAPGAPS